MTWWSVIWKALLAATVAFLIGWFVGLAICWWLATHALDLLIR